MIKMGEDMKNIENFGAETAGKNCVKTKKEIG